MTDRLRLGLIFGGRSVEHEVSVVSAEHVIAAAAGGRFEVVPIGVTKSGAWLSPAETQAQLAEPAPSYEKRLVSPSPQAERGPGGEVGRADLGAAVDALAGHDVIFPLKIGRA